MFCAGADLEGSASAYGCRRRARSHVRLCRWHPAALFAHRGAAAGHAGRDRRRGDGRRLRAGAGLRPAHRGERSQARPAGSPARLDPRRRRHAAADAAVRPGARRASDPRRRNRSTVRRQRVLAWCIGRCRAPSSRSARPSSRARIAGLPAAALAASKACIAAAQRARDAAASPTNWNSPGRFCPTAETRQRVTAFLAGAAEPSTTDQKRSGTMNFDGKTALVTGGASGIGKATVMAFARAGATVICADVNAAAGEALKKEGNGKVDFVAVDLAKPEFDPRRRRRGAEEISAHRRSGQCSRLGRHPAVHARTRRTSSTASSPSISPARLHLTQALLPADDRGRTAARSSISPAMPAASAAGGETVYAGAKGGLIAFTKSLAREVARYSINVNCVCPGPTDTPMLATRSEKLREAFLKAIPFRRFAKPEEIADAVLFFASPQVRLRHRPGDERERRAHFCRLAAHDVSMEGIIDCRCNGQDRRRRHRGALSSRRARLFALSSRSISSGGRTGKVATITLEPAGTEESADARILCRAARHCSAISSIRRRHQERGDRRRRRQFLLRRRRARDHRPAGRDACARTTWPACSPSRA